MSNLAELGASAVDQLNLSDEVKAALKEVQAELAESYRESFLQMVGVINQQASAINRIQHTLELLVRHIEPSLAAQIPAAIRAAGDDEVEPDIASALLVADPIGAGYTLGVGSLSQALGLQPADVSVLLKAFRLHEDGRCAVVVRKGAGRQMVNYHPRAIERFRELVLEPPSGLDANQKSALKRVLKRGITTPPPAPPSAVPGASPAKKPASSPPRATKAK